MISRALANALIAARPMRWSEAFLLSAVAVTTSFPLIGGLYLVKSAMGINIFPGPSPLHDLLYHFVR
jgi:hypothetical protein